MKTSRLSHKSLPSQSIFSIEASFSRKGMPLVIFTKKKTANILTVFLKLISNFKTYSPNKTRTAAR